MMTAKVVFGHHMKRCQEDSSTGEILPRDKETKTILLLTAEITLGGLSQGFLAEGHIPEKGFNVEQLEKKTRWSTVDFLKRGWVANLFEPTKIDVPLIGGELDGVESNVELEDVFADKLLSQIKIGNKTTKALSETVETMSRLLDDPHSYSSQLREGVRFMEQCVDASGHRIMEAWCRENLASLQGAIDDLVRRKNTNHEGYKASYETACRCLRHWPTENIWVRKPPVLPDKEAV